MFTLRFEVRKGGPFEKYDVFTCERYNVSCERATPDEGEKETEAPLRKVVRMFRTSFDDNPYYETVGDREPYGCVFVMNSHGKTIDKIY